jgi:predicted RNA-binding Zn ribbon-like protein
MDRGETSGPRLALDLASTIAVVQPGEELDLLVTPAQLAAWMASEGAPLEPGDDVALRVAAFRALRDSIRTLFVAAVAGGSLPHPPAERLNAASAAVPRYPALDLSDAGIPRRVEEEPSVSRATELLAAIARSAIEIVGGPDRGRVRICPGVRCGRFFLASRPRQTWCSDRCGNRARVARHHARARGRRGPTGAQVP